MSGQFLTIFEFLIAFLLHSAALVRIGIIFKQKIERKKEMAPFLVCLLINWTFVCTLLIPYEGYGIAVWRPVEEIYHNSLTLFLIALPAHMALAAIPVSVFYLTLDRILVITYGFAVGQRTNKLVIYSYVLVILTGFGICTNGFISALNNMPEKTKCEIFGCILGPAVEVYLGWRAICSIFNFSSGLLFCILLYKSNKKFILGGNLQQPFPATALVINEQRKKQQTKNNKLTMLAIVNEFFLAFIPHFGPFLWEKIFGPGSSMGTGPLSEFMSGLEVFIFASVFSSVLNSNNSNIKSTTQTLREEKTKQNIGQVRPSVFSIQSGWTGGGQNGVVNNNNIRGSFNRVNTPLPPINNNERQQINKLRPMLQSKSA
uniref:Uncharacterized protein n=1 Tax=Meloidogyne incognita TaxID=6306 RepID=A0A914MWT1_MELIC